MTDLVAIDATVLDAVGEVLNEPVEALRAQPVLAAHDWDSISSLEALALLESRLGVTLDLRAYHGARTVDDLVDLVAAVVSTAAARRC